MRRVSVLLLLILCAGRGRAEQRPPITGIAQVRLYTASPEASAAFYGQELGLDRTAKGATSIYSVNALQSVAVMPLPTPAPPTRLAAVVFRTTDAAALERYLRGRKIPIAEPLAQGTFGVHDPEGNLILFTQAMEAARPSANAPARRMIHAGFVVKSREAEDAFYRDVLGFHIYWYGGQKDGQLDYVAMQVPDGSDWLEYMLNVRADATARQLGGSNHISLGLNHMADAVDGLRRNGCTSAECAKTQMGRDGKVQLNVFDPDLTRVEYMEFKPSGTTCCSAIAGKTPTDKEEK